MADFCDFCLHVLHVLRDVARTARTATPKSEGISASGPASGASGFWKTSEGRDLALAGHERNGRHGNLKPCDGKIMDTENETNERTWLILALGEISSGKKIIAFLKTFCLKPSTETSTRKSDVTDVTAVRIGKSTANLP